jgi:hypothetical protein
MFRLTSAIPARLPDDFGRRFVVCVDTEEEFDWRKPKRRDATSVRAIRALPEAQRRMEAAGVCPAYLMDFPVAQSAESAAIIGEFLARDACTIGSQLHPWVNPPFDEPMAVRNSFPGNLPRSLERAKLSALTEQIASSFGRRPVVYRAGRYGIGPNTVAVLDELGYRIDCSVRPLFDYGAEDGPSFWRAPICPHWLGPERRLLELPLTAVFVGGLARLGAPLFRAGERLPPLRSALARSRLLNRVSLTPEGMPLSETLEGLRLLIDEDVRFFSIAFHSPSVEPGHTPFVRDAEDLKQFYGWLDGVFNFLAANGVRSATPESVLAEAERGEMLAATRTAA